MEGKDLKFIKKHYGENFAHLCRELFPTILEHEGVLSNVISNHFAPSRSLYEDVLPLQDEFKSFIFSFVDVEKAEISEREVKSPEELLDEAGYILYPECKTEEEVQSFKKYYAEGEKLCTFNGGRLNKCRVWFAVKKDVGKIKRKNFTRPTRQDEYGTSVISIQFSKGNQSTLSIKNRYNHTVNNPDATFSNNLDNIIPGLTESFTKTYGIKLLSFDKNFEIPGYRLGGDGKFYKVNVEINGICYCENNIILNHGRVIELDKARYILADNYVVDKQTNTVKPQHGAHGYEDAFVQSLGEISNLDVVKNKDGSKTIVFTPIDGKEVGLTLSKSNSIVGYTNPNVIELGNCFLSYNTSLTELNLQNVVSIGDYFLDYNRSLTKLNLPKLTTVGDYFLFYNPSLIKLDLPSLTTVGDCFLWGNESLKKLYAPKLTTVGLGFLCNNRSLTELDLPKLTTVGLGFLNNNRSLTELDLPNLETCYDTWFLENNKNLIKLNLPKLNITSKYMEKRIKRLNKQVEENVKQAKRNLKKHCQKTLNNSNDENLGQEDNL